MINKYEKEKARKVLRELGWTTEMLVEAGYLRRTLTDDDIYEIAKSFKSRMEFSIKDRSAYSVARRKGILDKACSHMKAQLRTLTDDDIYEIAKSFKSRGEFCIKDRGAYNAAQRRGILDKACSHMKKKWQR